MEKWGGMQEKVGRGEGQGGMRDGRGVDPERKMEEGVSEEESPNRKEGLVLQKGECGGKREGQFPEKSPEIGFEAGKARKKWTTRGRKRACSLEKSSEIGCKMGKGKKNGLRRAKNGSGSSKNRPK